MSVKHSNNSLTYADDIQLYDNSTLANAESIRDRLTRCVSDVAKWCASRRLQLNDDPVWICFYFTHLAGLHCIKQSLDVRPSNIQYNSVVRDLGIYLDSELTMKQHIVKTSAACFYHIRRLHQIHRQVGQEVTQQLVMAFITSRIDYCNSLLAGLSSSTLEPLQQVQNAAARLVFGLGRFNHVIPSLIQLHWLPVIYRVQFKLCCIVHAIHHDHSPTYLMERVQVVSASRSRPRLRSSSTSRMDYALLRLRTTFGERAFSHTVRPPGTRCPTTSAPWLIQSVSEDC